MEKGWWRGVNSVGDKKIKRVGERERETGFCASNAFAYVLPYEEVLRMMRGGLRGGRRAVWYYIYVYIYI